MALSKIPDTTVKYETPGNPKHNALIATLAPSLNDTKSLTYAKYLIITYAYRAFISPFHVCPLYGANDKAYKQ